MTTQTVQPPDKKLWLAALKPPMYSVAVMPICIGTAVAFFETQAFHAGIFALFLLSAILILAWENLSNDVFDSDTGIDLNKAHSVVNLTRSRSLVFWLSNFVLALGILGIVAIALWQQDFTVLGLILLCCLLGYLYQGPPFRWGYQGLGEILCFFSFGPLAVSAAYYAQAQTWSITGLAASVIVGITTSLVLFCSHFHQLDDDLAAGKRSPIVRLGTWSGALLLPWIGSSVFVITAAFIVLDFFPVWTLLVFASLPPVVRLSQHVRRYHDWPEQVQNAKFVAIAFHFWSGLLLCLGFLIPHALPL
ncbi:MAG: 2-carboxy-1,4-naphthoquinone phytyltransferase [Leptolyngbyaceae cyanobacterium SM1_1_3]|nr:2-carboxy-1,4-naphthoquinone phytyltransferase [Leptolyngbyaceae cyanobacterium SM1_1_3]NJN01956.1 2-carboxy-1,4-naphthoquinone phytyltransferase [Leptolyngbyaceae cyanobacterium RM1_1_2]NJO10598.1 2-carboxy-1,4-naphthoquinone phytyltransferase [Leptolyngbyaceae cyanobacterium SL_1_1]